MQLFPFLEVLVLNLNNLYSENIQSLLQRSVEQFKPAIENFHILFMATEDEETFDYLKLFEQYLATDSIIQLDIKTVQQSKIFVLNEVSYQQNEALFYEIRLKARQHMIESISKSVIFHVIEQMPSQNSDILSNHQLLDSGLKKTQKIIQQAIFIGEVSTWNNFYDWCRDYLKQLVLEELIFTIGVQGMGNLQPSELNTLFFKILSTNLSENHDFIMKFSNATEAYIQQWKRQVVAELENDVQSYLKIEHEMGKMQSTKSPLRVIPNYVFVLNTVVYQAIREIMYKKCFQVRRYPFATFVKGRTSGMVEIVPICESEDERTCQQQGIMVMQSMSTIDVDVLDILCSIFLHQSKQSGEIIQVDLSDILAMRGLKAKLGGGGRRGGYEPKQKQQIIQALRNIQCLWITLEKSEFYQKYQTEQSELQGRAVKFCTAAGEEYIVSEQTCQKTVSFTFDEVFEKYMRSKKRQVALLPTKAIQYHAYRHSLEKQLCRYLSWRWRTQAFQGNFLQPNKVSTLLFATAEKLNERSPQRTRERLEKALDQLASDQIIAAWHYIKWDENITANKGWSKYWLNTSIVIEPSPIVQDHYRSIERKSKQERVPKQDDSKLGERLLSRRKERNITLLQLAEELDVTAPYISNIERNKVKPSAKLRAKILKWLD